MAIQNRQIGWSQESNLLWQILKQINKLTSVIFGLKEAAIPKYKVYTALLTQNGGGSAEGLNSGPVTKGVTYEISGIDGDFSNVGAPNNNDDTFFVAINNEIPNSYGTSTLKFNTGAPVVTVLENTIGNIWFTYDGTGLYSANSDALFTVNKTVSFNSVSTDSGNPDFITIQNNNVNTVSIKQFDSSGVGVDTITAASIEIRVYS